MKLSNAAFISEIGMFVLALMAFLKDLLKGMHTITYTPSLVLAVALVISATMRLIAPLLSRAKSDTQGLPVNAKIVLKTTTLDQRSTDPTINYKAKLRAVFTNESEQAIHVRPLSWITGPDDVPVQYPLGFRYQVEEHLGSWKSGRFNKQELKDVAVNPGWSFIVYVGLDQSVSHSELDKRRNTRRLGTLIIPFEAGGQVYRWEDRI